MIDDEAEIITKGLPAGWRIVSHSDTHYEDFELQRDGVTVARGSHDFPAPEPIEQIVDIYDEIAWQGGKSTEEQEQEIARLRKLDEEYPYVITSYCIEDRALIDKVMQDFRGTLRLPRQVTPAQHLSKPIGVKVYIDGVEIVDVAEFDIEAGTARDVHGRMHNGSRMAVVYREGAL